VNLQIDSGLIPLYGLGIILLYMVGRAFFKPMKIISKIVYNSILGLLALLVINFVGKYFGFNIALNIYSVLITGFLGIPGLALLIVLRFIYLGHL
jgi:inhibitor of the pro-sigma K processing machinery